MKYWGEDAHQEYALALLEGCDDEAAEKRARKADSEIFADRIGRGHVNHHETMQFLDLRSATVDDRYDWEVEVDHARSDEQRAEALRLLEHCTPRQREALRLRHGFETGHPMTLPETAAAMGITNHSAVRKHCVLGWSRIRKAEWEASDPTVMANGERLLQKRIRDRERQRRIRSAQRMGVAA